MKVYEITFSPTGGTDKAAHLLTSKFECEKEQISLLKQRDYSEISFEKEDICLIAVPSFGGRVPAAATERLKQIKGNGARCVVVAVYGNRAYEDTLLELKETAKEAGFYPVAAVGAVAEHSIMHQFAVGRPDAEDKKELERFSEAVWEKLQREPAEEAAVPGNREYKKYGVIPMIPEANETCSACGRCAMECPVGAISKENPGKTEKEKCISCMRCISVCPKQARALDEALLAGAVEKLKKACSERKENELFI